MEDFLRILNVIFLFMLMWGLLKPNKIFLPNRFTKNRKNIFLFYFILLLISTTLFNTFYNKKNVVASPLLDNENKQEVKKEIVMKEKIHYKQNTPQMAEQFGYVLQGSMICDNLIMRVDTEEKLRKRLGVKDVRKPSLSHLNGIERAIKNEHNGLCRDIWEKYGCYGSEIPRLIQESPFRVKNPVLCEF